MNPNAHKVDLDLMGCAYFEVLFSGLDSPSDAPLLDELLDDGVAAGSYSRRRNRFGVLVSALIGEGPPEYRSSWFALPQDGGVPPRVGDPWSALGVLMDTARRADVNCGFHVTSDREPKLALPLELFSLGSFPFNQLSGYRAALVESDKTIWTAIVDRVDAPGDIAVSIHFEDYDLESAASSRDLLSACVAVRDSLMQEVRDE